MEGGETGPLVPGEAQQDAAQAAGVPVHQTGPPVPDAEQDAAQSDAVPVHEEGAAESEARIEDGHNSARVEPAHEAEGAAESEGRIADKQTSQEGQILSARGQHLWGRVREELAAGRLVTPEGAEAAMKRRATRKIMETWFQSVAGIVEQKRLLVDLTLVAQNYTVANNAPDAVSNMRAKQATLNPRP